MTQYSFPWNDVNGDRLYDADDFMRFFAAFLKTGVVMSYKGGLRVRSAQNGMNIQVGSGSAVIGGSSYLNDADIGIQVNVASSIQDRVDSVVLRMDKNARTTQLFYKPGDTTVAHNDTTYELQLATISVKTNATQITDGDITDKRSDSTVCGWSTPFDNINVDGIVDQYKEIFSQADVQFQEWFKNLKNQLDDNQASNLQNQLDSLDSKVYTAYANSADGTDGFTTIYPNLNLLSLSSVKIGQYLNWANGLDLLDNAKRAVFDYIQVTPNQTYTLSSSWNGWYISVFGYSDKTSSAKYILTGGKMQPITGSGLSESKNVTFTVPSDCNYLRVHIGNDNTNTSASVVKSVKAKVEPGSTATPYIQSASEATINDYPQYKYVGRMAGLNVADKSDPKNYMWQRNTDVVRDQNGTVLVKDLEVTDSLKLPSLKANVTTKEGLILNLYKKGELVICRFGGDIANATSGKVLTGPWVDIPFRPTETQQLMGHFAGRDTSFHIDLKPDGSMIWWGATIGTSPLTSRGNANYFLN